jgi:hypothetical protein
VAYLEGQKTRTMLNNTDQVQETIYKTQSMYSRKEECKSSAPLNSPFCMSTPTTPRKASQTPNTTHSQQSPPSTTALAPSSSTQTCNQRELTTNHLKQNGTAWKQGKEHGYLSSLSHLPAENTAGARPAG